MTQKADSATAGPPMNPKIAIRGPGRWGTLATYNAECARGLVHTPEWAALMAEEQALFDKAVRRG